MERAGAEASWELAASGDKREEVVGHAQDSSSTNSSTLDCRQWWEGREKSEIGVGEAVRCSPEAVESGEWDDIAGRWRETVEV